MRAFRPSFINEPLPRLMAMAEAWDVTLDSASPRELLEAILARAQEGDTALQARAALPEEARAALDALLLADGHMPVATFERRFGALRAMGAARLERERPWHAPANSAEVLWYRGFISRGFDRGTPPVDMFYVPSELAARLAKAEAGRTDTEANPQHAAPLAQDFQAQSPNQNRSGPLSSLLDDAVTVLAHTQNHEESARGEWLPRLREALVHYLQDANSTRFSWLICVLKDAGLLQPINPEKKLRLNARAVAQWLQLPGADQLAALRESWLNSSEWNDLLHVPRLIFERTHAWHNNPLMERKAIVEFLNTHPTATMAAFKTAHADFMRRDGRYDTWHIKDATSGELLHGFEHWERIEGGLFEFVRAGPLNWLMAQPTQTTPALFGISPAGDVDVPLNLRYERFQLSRIADSLPRRDADSHRFRISPASLARGRAQGISAARVMEFLQRNTHPVPELLLAAIKRSEARGSEARARPVLLLRTRDAASMDALLQHEAFAKLQYERVAPNAVALPSESAAELRAAALTAGVLVD